MKFYSRNARNYRGIFQKIKCPTEAVDWFVFYNEIYLYSRGSQRDAVLSWLTNSPLVYEPNCGGMGVGGGAGSQSMSTVVHMEPK
jgi:hypothetical protein